MIARYKEIIFGLGLGFGMWLVDAAMHVQIGSRAMSWAASFSKELFYPGPAQLFFRMLFLVMAAFFGLLLWHGNLRQRRYRALANAFDQLRRRLTSRTMLIVAHSRALSTDPLLRTDSSARNLVEGIYESARELERLADEPQISEKEGGAPMFDSREGTSDEWLTSPRG